MPPKTFNLTQGPEGIIRNLFPNWPVVTLGQSVHRTTGQLIQEIVLPPALDEEQLKQRVDVGRLQLQKLLECNAEKIHLVAVPSGYYPNERTKDYQVYMTNDDNPARLWEISDRSPNYYNLGCIQVDKHWRAEGDNGCIVNRDFDHILSVLESLEVGQEDPPVKWEQARTINSTVHPYGPTVRLKACQDKAHKPEPARRYDPNDSSIVQPTNSTIEAFYNVFDGAIFVTKLQFSAEAAREAHVPPPRWCAPRDVIWYCWDAMHTRQTAPLRGNEADHFPRFSAPGHDDSKWKPVSGRLPSPKRAGLNDFYRSVDSDDPNATILPHMKYFLNYVSFSGEAITKDDVAIIRKCLGSRQAYTSEAAVWGYHDTFQVGHWAFYALLSSKVGTELVKLLTEHKLPHDLGKKFVHSITVFAADCRMDKTPPGTGTALVKWPVLLFEICKFNGDASERREVESRYVDADGNHMRTTNGQRWLFPGILCPQIGAPESRVCPRIVLPSDATYDGKGFPGNRIFSQLYQGNQMKYL